jgi:hypothetical protein
VTDLATADLSFSDAGPVEHVGKFAMRVILAAPGAEASQRWAQRDGMLAQWLVAEWQHEHQERGCA